MDKNFSLNTEYEEEDRFFVKHKNKVHKILVIEDDEFERLRLSVMLTRLFPQVTIDWASGCKSAREKLKWTQIRSIGPYDFIIADMYYPGLDTGLGLVMDLLDSYKKEYSSKNLFLMSSAPIEKISQKGAVKLPVRLLKKPYDFLSLKSLLSNSHSNSINAEEMENTTIAFTNPKFQKVLEKAIIFIFLICCLYMLFLILRIPLTVNFPNHKEPQKMARSIIS